MMADDLHRPRPYSDWHEDHGDVLWWRIPISEPPYVGSPLDLGRTMMVEIYIGTEQFEFPAQQTGGWPFGDHTRNLWWTPLPDAKRIEDQVESVTMEASHG